jgi:V/A-type H+-transporting ATPase subunit E
LAGEKIMEQKLQELTSKIFEEGVEKGKAKAEEIVKAAKARSEQILSDAKAESDKIISEAKKEGEELKRNMESEIQLSGRQAVSTIKQQILDAVTAKVLDEKVIQAMGEQENIKAFIAAVVKNWNPKETPKLEVLLPENKKKEMEGYFKTQAQKEIAKGLEVRFTKNLKGGFQIGPKDSTFRISLSDQDFIEFFRQFLRPKIKTYLFGE